MALAKRTRRALLGLARNVRPVDIGGPSRLRTLDCCVMRHRRTRSRFSIDSNGCPTETTAIDGQTVVIPYDDIPESDVTVVQGLRVTTPLRTVIDLAPELSTSDLRRVVDDCVKRGLFTIDQALARLAAPDMAARPGARILRGQLPPR